jgi:hypothetical protein
VKSCLKWAENEPLVEIVPISSTMEPHVKVSVLAYVADAQDRHAVVGAFRDAVVEPKIVQTREALLERLGGAENGRRASADDALAEQAHGDVHLVVLTVSGSGSGASHTPVGDLVAGVRSCGFRGPIFGLVRLDDASAAHEARRAGVDAVLTMPLSPTTVRVLVEVAARTAGLATTQSSAERASGERASGERVQALGSRG